MREQLGVKLRHNEVPFLPPSISDTGSVLDDIAASPLLDVGRAAGPEVEVETAKVHLAEILAVVHVGEIVEVGGPAEAVDDTLAVDVEGREDLAEEASQDEPENPVEIEEGDHKQEKEGEVEQHPDQSSFSKHLFSERRNVLNGFCLDQGYCELHFL